MDTSSFNKAIQQFFRDTYCVEYLEIPEVTYIDDGDMYRFFCHFPLNQQDKQITMSGQFNTLDEFTVFTINELKIRRFPIVDYFKLTHAEREEKKT